MLKNKFANVIIYLLKSTHIYVDLVAFFFLKDGIIIIKEVE
jgi:hypothetical protein